MGKLNDIIAEYSAKNPIRFHMPGHKGKQICFNELNFSKDVTELFFTDNLYSPDINSRLIYDLEKRISQCFFENNSNSAVSYILCGGGTLGIQAAVLSLVRNENISGENLYIICERNCHISFINTLSLLGINPLWIYPEENFIEKTEYFIKNYNNIIGVFVTSPDYFGVMHDIREISSELKKYSLPLAVDNSHGSHLTFYNRGELHPINCGADISVDSVHKTLPALTGAAIIHANTQYHGYDKLRECIKIFASTSPSFLILQSVEIMADYLENHGHSEHERLISCINIFKKKAAELNIISEHSEISDPYRIVLTAENSGEKLYYFLYKKNIVCEFFDKNNVIIIPSVLNQSSDFDALFYAVKNFAEVYPVKSNNSVNFIEFPKNPKTALSLNSAVKLPRKCIPAEKSLNRISAESIFAYPPGIPVVLPGEIIDENIYDIIKDMRDKIDVIV